MATKPWAIALVLVCSLIVSSAQILFKIAAPHGLFNLSALAGFALMGLGMVFLTLAMKGGDVSVLAPILATNYFWVNLLAHYYFQEPITAIKWAGTVVIVIGISMISWGGRE